MATSITMETSYSGKQSTRSITNVNPNATADEISTFAKGLNDLTNNTLKTVNRVDKTEINTDTVYYEVHGETDAFTIENATFDDATKTATVNVPATGSLPETYCTPYWYITVDGQKINLDAYAMTIKYTLNVPRIYVYSDDTRSTWGFDCSNNAYDSSQEQKIEVLGGTVTSNGNVYNYKPFTFTIKLNKAS